MESLTLRWVAHVILKRTPLQLPPKLRAWGIVAECRRRRIGHHLRLRLTGQEPSWTGQVFPEWVVFPSGGRVVQVTV